MPATAEQIQEIERQSIGTENWYKHPMVKDFLYTDGVKAVAATAGAYWLVDRIAFNQLKNHVASTPFQLWILDVKDGSAELTMREDSDRSAVIEEKIDHTDFPTGTWKFYVEGNVLLLPSEH